MDETKKVLTEKYTTIKPIVPLFVETFFLVQQAQSGKLEVSKDKEGESVLGGIGATSSRRALSARDLMKWCDRCESVLNGTSLKPTIIPGKVKEIIFAHAVDSFCASFATPETRLALAKVIASVWGITEDRLSYFFDTYKPSVEATDTMVTIGATTLPVREEKSAVARGMRLLLFCRVY